MGIYYWIDEVYCHADSVIGALLLYVILAIQKFWTIIGGISLVAGELYLAALVFWGFQEALFVHRALSLKFLEHRPACTTMFDALVEETRVHAMPSLEALLVFSVSSFLVIHMLLVRYQFPLKILVSIIGLPIVASIALYITYNNTLGQIIFGAFVGIVLGIRNVLLYHYFLKYHLETLSMLRLLKWVLPSGKIIPTGVESSEDQDTKMLKASTPVAAAVQRRQEDVRLLHVI